jgi:hypothetical protein
MRLFAAVLPPEAVVRELASEVDELERLPGADGLRWTGRPGWHFTLAFYGEVDEELVPDLSERLSRAAHRTAPFPLSLRGGGHFGGRALWVGVSGGVPALRLLADRAEAAARKAGVASRGGLRDVCHRPARVRRAGVDGAGAVSRTQPSAEVGGAGGAAPLRDGGELASGGGRRAGIGGRLTSTTWTRRPETGSWPVCSC